MFYSRDELIHAATYIADKNNTMDELYHHGILGMKWGVRRYQNEDGTLTPAGKKRLSRYEKKINAIDKDIQSYEPIRNGLVDKKGRQILTKEDVDESVKALKDLKKKLTDKENQRFNKRIEKFDKDIQSYEPIRNGLVDKKGRQILTKEDVDSMVSSLESQKIKWAQKNANTDEARRTVDKLLAKQQNNTWYDSDNQNNTWYDRDNKMIDRIKKHTIVKY